jgi:hypothetical protein
MLVGYGSGVQFGVRSLALLFSALVLGGAPTPFADAPSSARATTSEWHASQQHYEVFLAPPVQGGSVGWCVVNTVATRMSGNLVATGGGFGCPIVLTPGRPILDESWSGSSPPPVLRGLVLTRSEVAAVSVNGGTPIPTRTEPGLPYGLRAVLLEMNGTTLMGRPPELTPLSMSGQALTQPPMRPMPTAYGLETSGWKRPGHPKLGACKISATHVPGLTARWGRVVRHVRAISDLIGRPFLSCADTEYFFQNWPLDAGIVLDATHPGVPPAPLPLMKPAAGHPGYYQAPGGNGNVLARRIHGAWLLVEGGSGLQQRFVVLSHLRATIHL